MVLKSNLTVRQSFRRHREASPGRRLHSFVKLISSGSPQGRTAANKSAPNDSDGLVGCSHLVWSPPYNFSFGFPYPLCRECARQPRQLGACPLDKVRDLLRTSWPAPEPIAVSVRAYETVHDVLTESLFWIH